MNKLLTSAAARRILMAVDRGEFIDGLKESYAVYYDIHPNEDHPELPLDFRADFHSKGESYFLVKSAKIWSNENNEYVYVFSAPSFDAETVNKCVDHALEDGLAMVVPHKEHNYSNIITVFVADEIAPEIRKHIQNRRFSKSYHMSLYGFSLLKTGYIDLNTSEYGTNKEGHDLTNFFKKLFPKKQFLKK
jgi:hypothetical protein